jgi:hypothetical protein
MGHFTEQRMREDWRKDVQPKLEADLERFFREEGDLDYWVDWVRSQSPLGKLYVNVVTKVTTDVSIDNAEGGGVDRSYWSTQYIGMSVGKDVIDSEVGGGMHDSTMSGHQEDTIYTTSFELVDVGDLAAQEVRAIEDEVGSIAIDWARISGKRVDALVQAAGDVATAYFAVLAKDGKKAGGALRDALKALPASSWAEAVEDPRLQELAAELEEARQYLEEIAKRFP